ncbi:hypothetical protein TOPH_07436 [Tolypocladium ophioglossoides CBS 100239]|uniref:Uncharacterized protein n=1 Tax=Tolypocladium ophioglossoides (strain CBS 100239) TaxID=1163406 RepID=A0A0L0N182_TOLOC|nr:hypothetical protein TOPH_07436 [Tolypocladium ophioglossoides CBS 100239]
MSNVDRWLQDKHSPRRAKQTGGSRRDQEESGVLSPLVVAPRSNASDSLPDIPNPSDASDDASSESLDVRPLHTNQTTATATVSLSDTGILDPGDEVAAVVGPADDADSTFGKGPPSSSASLSPSIIEHEWKYGHRYHSYQAGSYCFPNDDKEQSRLDILHRAFQLALDDRHFLAPIGKNPSRILDTIDVADEYPSAGVRGYDLSPIQPQHVPPNVDFFVDNVEDEWRESTKYDFVHLRNVIGSIADWPRLVRQMHENLKPGGWVELQGILNQPYSTDGALSSDNPVMQLMDGLRQAGSKRGRDMDPASSFKRWAESAGFVTVQERRFPLPVGCWPKDPKLKAIGIFMAESLLEGIDGLTAVPFREILGWSEEEVQVLNAMLRRVVRGDTHAIFDFVVVTGMKPTAGL